MSVVASQGWVELLADVADDERPSALTLTGNVATGSGGPRPLRLVRCGPACWTGPVDWQDGVTTLTLDAAAQRYDGGRVRIPVSWPVVAAPALVARVQAAMGACAAIDTVETVTSGSGTVLPHRSRRTGQEFLEGQPWAQGGATDVTVVDDGADRTLLFALPAQGYHFAMRLDSQDRIISERIVTPNHLLIRQYRYP